METNNKEVNIVDMINEITLKYKISKDASLITAFLTAFSMEMASIHANNQFITFRNFEKNKVVNKRIIFDEVHNMPIDNKAFYVSKNLERFAALAIGLYLDVDHSKVLHEDAIKTTDVWKTFIDPPHHVEFYTAVLNNEYQETLYYHDYLKVLDREKGMAPGKKYVKALPNIVAPTDVDEIDIHLDEDKRQMAFAQSAYLIITLTLFAIIMFTLAYAMVYL